jgi:hypothetical protein
LKTTKVNVAGPSELLSITVLSVMHLPLLMTVSSEIKYLTLPINEHVDNKKTILIGQNFAGHFIALSEGGKQFTQRQLCNLQ